VPERSHAMMAMATTAPTIIQTLLIFFFFISVY
jgi:hypothetical protein